MDSEWDVARVLIVIGVAFVIVCIIGGVLWRAVFFQPYQDNAFNQSVQGLVTEYCTAPQPVDQQGARQQLIQLVDGKPNDFKNIPAALHTSAQAVYDNHRMEACHQDDPSH